MRVELCPKTAERKERRKKRMERRVGDRGSREGRKRGKEEGENGRREMEKNILNTELYTLLSK